MEDNSEESLNEFKFNEKIFLQQLKEAHRKSEFFAKI